MFLISEKLKYLYNISMLKRLFFGFGLFILLIPTFIFAAPKYTALPLVIDISAEKRDILTKEITVTNTGIPPVTLYPSVNSISLNEGGDIEEFVSASMLDRTTSVTSWIEISRAGITLQSGESRVLPVTLRINPNVKDGVYHAFIGFGHGRTSTDAKALVDSGQAPGTIITIRVAEEINEFIKLSRFLIDKFVISAENESVQYKVNNPGDTLITPAGDIIFYDSRGIEVASVPVNPEKKAIKPGEEQTFTTSAPAEGLLGKYKAFLSVEYGVANIASVQDTTFFYVIPWKKLLFILLILLVTGGVIAYVLHKKYINENEEEDVDRIPLHHKETLSEALHHDIDLKKKND